MILAWAAAVLFAAAAVRDLGWRTIDNRLVVCLLIAWAGHSVLAGWGVSQLLSHIGIGLLAFALTLACGMMGWMGGGDVKLAAAVFIWAGPDRAVAVLVLVTAAGFVLALLGLAARLADRSPLPAAIRRGLATVSSARGVPYGVALALGGVAAAFSVPVGG